MAKLTLDELLEWKDRCAFDLCSEPTQLSLARAGRYLFEDLAALETRGAVDVDLPDRPRAAPQDPSGCVLSNSWRLFEQYAVTGRHGSGKRYKDWILDHGTGKQDPVHRCNSLNNGLWAVMRNVVRPYVADDRKREKLRKDLGIVSLSPERSDESGQDILDCYDADALLCTSAQLDVSQLDLVDIDPHARRLAEDLAREAPDRERIVLLAADLGLNITGESVQALCGCGRSQLSEARKSFKTRLEQVLDQKYSEFDANARILLKARVVQFLLESIFLWAKSEKRLEPLFKAAEAIESEGQI